MALYNSVMDKSVYDGGETGPEWTPVSTREAYAHVRRSLITVLRRPGEPGRIPVPSCPGWTVRDVIAHVTGICQQAAVSLSPDQAAPAVPLVDGLDLEALLAEWERSGSRLDIALARPEHAGRGGRMMMDAFTHELDIRLAIGAPLPAAHPAYPGAFAVVTGGFSASVASRGLPALRLQTPAGSWTAGDGEPAAVVRGSVTDMYRSLAGRRTVQQIRQLDWSAEPERWIPAFTWGPFIPPADPAQ